MLAEWEREFPGRIEIDILRDAQRRRRRISPTRRYSILRALDALRAVGDAMPEADGEPWDEG